MTFTLGVIAPSFLTNVSLDHCCVVIHDTRQGYLHKIHEMLNGWSGDEARVFFCFYIVIPVVTDKMIVGTTNVHNNC